MGCFNTVSKDLPTHRLVSHTVSIFRYSWSTSNSLLHEKSLNFGLHVGVTDPFNCRRNCLLQLYVFRNSQLKTAVFPAATQDGTRSSMSGMPPSSYREEYVYHRRCLRQSLCCPQRRIRVRIEQDSVECTLHFQLPYCPSRT